MTEATIRHAACIALLFSVTACSDYYPVRVSTPPVTYDTTSAAIAVNMAAQWTGEHAWRIDSVPSLRIEPGTQQAAHPVGILRNRAGEIVVADASGQLFVHARTGSFLRQGAACGLTRVRSMYTYRGDSIALHDGDMNVAIVATDAQCGRDVRIARPAATDANMLGDTLWGGDVVVAYPDGSFAASSYGTLGEDLERGAHWYTVHLFRVTPEGAISDTLGLFPGGEVFWARKRARPLEFGRRIHAATDGFDLIVGESSWFRFARFDTTGVPKLITSRPHYVDRVGNDDRMAVIRTYDPAEPDTMKLLEARKWPDRKPAYSNVLVDPEGHVWMEEYRFGVDDAVGADPATVFWSVFHRDGAWLGQVEVPGRFLVKRVYSDMLLGVWKDENGTSSVRGYRLTKPDVEDGNYGGAVDLRQAR